MFPTAPDQRPETPAEQARRRARTGTDRRGLKQVAIAFTLIFGGIAAFVAADIAGLERRVTTATIVSTTDRWNSRRTHDCVIELATGYGYARLFASRFCRDTPWHVGDHAEVEARQLRFSKAVVVSTRGTIFDGAHSVLPDS